MASKNSFYSHIRAFYRTELSDRFNGILAAGRHKSALSAKKLPNVTEIFVPGERESILARKRTESGLIEVEDNLLAELRKVAG